MKPLIYLWLALAALYVLSNIKSGTVSQCESCKCLQSQDELRRTPKDAKALSPHRWFRPLKHWPLDMRLVRGPSKTEASLILSGTTYQSEVASYQNPRTL